MGTRFLLAVVSVPVWDHPHAYGDKPMTEYEEEDIKGSSPRVWGQESLYPSSCKRSRIIPTRMGTRYYGNFLDYAP